MAVDSVPFSKIPRETYRSHFCLSILRSRDNVLEGPQAEPRLAQGHSVGEAAGFPCKSELPAPVMSLFSTGPKMPYSGCAIGVIGVCPVRGRSGSVRVGQGRSGLGFSGIETSRPFGSRSAFRRLAAGFCSLPRLFVKLSPHVKFRIGVFDLSHCIYLSGKSACLPPGYGFSPSVFLFSVFLFMTH